MWKVVKQVIAALPKYKWGLSIYLALTIIVIALGVLQPYVYKQAIDGLIALF